MSEHPRPPDWENKFPTEREEAGMFSKAEIFEEGADAIYQFAKEEGIKEAINEMLAFDTITTLTPGEG